MEGLKKQAKRLLLRNFTATGGKYICPSWPHYPWQWAWDSCFHAIVCAHLGLEELGKNEIKLLLASQEKEGARRGFIPHQIYWKDMKRFNFRKYFDWERVMYKGVISSHSSLLAQPVLAQAVRAIGDKYFFLNNAQSIISFYRYWIDGRNLFSISPRETGRDSSPEFDFFRLRGLTPVKILEAPVELISLFFLELRYKLMGWDETKILKSGIFNVKDLATQCLYLDGLYDLVWMMENWDGSCKKFPEIKAIIGMVEKSILDKCWNEEDGAFYGLRGGKEQLKDLTVASLLPCLMKDLPKDKLEAIKKDIRDPNKFASPYPIPSVSLSHPKFNPAKTWPIWRGPVWINMVWFLLRGLKRNGEEELAGEIAKPILKMVAREGFREFYDPFSGKGLRVKNFGWSTLAATFDSIV